MSAAVDVRGLKRVCVACGIRFYDLNKRPIKCPNCEVEFTGEIKLKTRRGRAAAAEAIAEAEDTPAATNKFVETEEVEKTDDTISLDEVVEEEDSDDDDDEALEGGDIESLEDLDDDDDIEEEIVVEVEKE